MSFKLIYSRRQKKKKIYSTYHFLKCKKISSSYFYIIEGQIIFSFIKLCIIMLQNFKLY